MFPAFVFERGLIMILVDFDNTLCQSAFDLDLEHNKKQSVTWFQRQTKTQAVSFSWANLLLADWLKGKDFYIFTNRGIETQEETGEILFYLFDGTPPTLYCHGTKQAVLKNFMLDYFLIDNNPVYEPNFVFTECISIFELDKVYKQWRGENDYARYTS